MQSLRLLMLLLLVARLVCYYIVNRDLVTTLGSLDVPILSNEYSRGKAVMLVVLVDVLGQLLV